VEKRRSQMTRKANQPEEERRRNGCCSVHKRAAAAQEAHELISTLVTPLFYQLHTYLFLPSPFLFYLILSAERVSGEAWGGLLAGSKGEGPAQPRISG
jgi:hypothetical protein